MHQLQHAGLYAQRRHSGLLRRLQKAHRVLSTRESRHAKTREGAIAVRRRKRQSSGFPCSISRSPSTLIAKIVKLRAKQNLGVEDAKSIMRTPFVIEEILSNWLIARPATHSITIAPCTYAASQRRDPKPRCQTQRALRQQHQHNPGHDGSCCACPLPDAASAAPPAHHPRPSCPQHSPTSRGF